LNCWKNSPKNIAGTKANRDGISKGEHFAVVVAVGDAANWKRYIHQHRNSARHVYTSRVLLNYISGPATRIKVNNGGSRLHLLLNGAKDRRRVELYEMMDKELLERVQFLQHS
jgi:hypothetical protein